MIVAGDDIIMSVIKYVAATKVNAKTPGGEDDGAGGLTPGAFVMQTLATSYKDLVSLPYALDFEPDTHGPRLGFRLVNEQPTTVFFGGATLYQWSLVVEIDAKLLDTTGQPDFSGSLRALYALKASLSELFDEGKTIACNVYFDATDTNIASAGSLIVLTPRIYSVSDYEAALICTLQKAVAPK